MVLTEVLSTSSHSSKDDNLFNNTVSSSSAPLVQGHRQQISSQVALLPPPGPCSHLWDGHGSRHQQGPVSDIAGQKGALSGGNTCAT